MNRQVLLTELRRYKKPHSQEQPFIGRFENLLSHPRCYHRDHLPGHLTGSAWILNESKTKVLLACHAALRRWLQPGGHADGEEDILAVALREAREETGLRSVKELQGSFFDIDIHRIPSRNDFPEHDHYDVRFLLQAIESEELKISDESTDLRWVALADLEKYNPDPSLLRLRSKST